jgi:hypothetical protein
MMTYMILPFPVVFGLLILCGVLLGAPGRAAQAQNLPRSLLSVPTVSACLRAAVFLAVLSAGLAPHVGAASTTDDRTSLVAETSDQAFEVESGSMSSEHIPASTVSSLLSLGNLIDFANPTTSTSTQVVDDGFTMDVDGNATLNVISFLNQMNVVISSAGSGFVLTESTSADFSITSFDGFQSVFGEGSMALVVTARDAGNASIATHTFNLTGSNTTYNTSGT